MRIYISGPITGTKDYMNRFQAAESLLQSDGNEVINPAKICAVMPKDTTKKEFMTICFLLIVMADVVYMLKGWENSLGANQEYGYAMGLDKIIVMEDEGNDGN